MEPKVTLREHDLSISAPKYPGVASAIIIPAKKGPVEQPILITSDSHLLKTFTPNESIEVDYAIGYYSAEAYLEGSDKLWVIRAASHSSPPTLAGANVPILLDNQTSPLSDINDIQTDDTLNPTLAPVIETRYLIKDAGNLHANFGTIPGIENNDIIQYTTEWDIVFDANVEGATSEVHTRNIADNTWVSWNGSSWTEGLPWDKQEDWTFDTGQPWRDIELGQYTFPTDTAFVVLAKNPGDWANGVWDVEEIDGGSQKFSIKEHSGITFTISEYTKEDPEKEAFLLTVFKDGVAIPNEAFVVCRKPGIKDGFGRSMFIEDRTRSSNHIQVLDNPAAIDENGKPLKPMFTTTTAMAGLEDLAYIPLTGGEDGNPVTDGDMIRALGLLDDTDAYEITLMLDGGWTTANYHLAIINLCQNKRKDTLGILSMPQDATQSSDYVNEMLSYRNGPLPGVDIYSELSDTLASVNTSFCSLNAPYLGVYDRFNDRLIYVPPDGFVGAIICKTASNFELWYPPAGFRRGTVLVNSIERRFTEGERDILYDHEINCFRFSTKMGVVRWGQQTLYSMQSALNGENVRLLLVEIEPAIKKLLENFLFEINDESNRDIVTVIINSYLEDKKGKRAIHDYKTVCNEDNNSKEDMYTMNVHVFIKPVLAIRYIPVTMVITKAGVSFALAENLLFKSNG